MIYMRPRIGLSIDSGDLDDKVEFIKKDANCIPSRYTSHTSVNSW